MPPERPRPSLNDDAAAKAEAVKLCAQRRACSSNKKRQPLLQQQRQSSQAATTPAATTTTTKTTLTHEPVVAALQQGTKAKPASEGTASDAVRDVLIGVLQEVALDLQRGADLSGIISTLIRGLFQLVTAWRA
ncbi:hypothetical protein ACJJTC_004044 [Scirpophaga incertulas]